MGRAWPLWGVTVVAVGALVVVLTRRPPPRTGPRELTAIATLRNLVSAQSQFQATARADENHNGVGEYGSLGELSGAVPVRGGVVFDPPVLPETFGQIVRGRVERSGYYFRIYLPRAGDGAGLSERAEGGYDLGVIHPDLAERVWCAYAWPMDPAADARTFFVDPEGDITWTRGYAGDREPSPSAAFEPGGLGITGTAAVEAQGQDGKLWKRGG